MFSKDVDVPTPQTRRGSACKSHPVVVFGTGPRCPPEGWPAFLGRRAIVFLPDDLGRDCVRRQDARRLLDERRGDELRRRKRAAVQQEMEEAADKQRRALIWKGVAATALPAGVGAGDAMLQAARDSRPRRTTPLEEAFDGGGSTFHALRPAG